MRDDGLVVGSVSGGCVEDDLIDRVRKGERVGKPSLVTYGVTKEEAARFGLPCGGNLRLVQEPLTGHRMGRRGAGAHRAPRAGGAPARPGHRHRDHRACRARRGFPVRRPQLRALFGPRWRLLIIGAGQLSRALAQMALALDFEVICCDPREEYHLTWDVPGTTFSKSMPDDLVLELQLDPHSAVIAVTHDPKLDDMVLLEALKSPAFYVGALGSRGNTAKRKERLALFDLSPAEIDRLHGPIGLDLGSAHAGRDRRFDRRRDRRRQERRGADAEEGRFGAAGVARSVRALLRRRLQRSRPSALCASATKAAARRVTAAPGSPPARLRPPAGRRPAAFAVGREVKQRARRSCALTTRCTRPLLPGGRSRRRSWRGRS
jgi:xanthine dehydrogenase accessory factor